MTTLTARYGGILLSPRRGPGVCAECFNLTRGYERCFACDRALARASARAGEFDLDAMAPISYSIAHGSLRQVLAGYKRGSGPVAERDCAELAAIMWRFLSAHEACLARAVAARRHGAAGARPRAVVVNGFDLVTTVPSGDRERDERHPLRRIVGELVAPTRGRHERLLRRSAVDMPARRCDPRRFEATRLLRGERILLIDDTWTTGASARSAAATLRAAGASAVGAVVIGRHLNPEWHENRRRLRGLALPFDWSRCPLCAVEQGSEPADAHVHDTRVEFDRGHADTLAA